MECVRPQTSPQPLYIYICGVFVYRLSPMYMRPTVQLRFRAHSREVLLLWNNTGWFTIALQGGATVKKENLTY